MEAFGVNGGDGMIIFYEYLINEALRIVDLKGTVDDINWDVDCVKQKAKSMLLSLILLEIIQITI